MPKIPKWMANAMESLFSGSYHTVEVAATKYLAKTFKHVRFQGDFSRVKKDFFPGNVIEFRVNDTQFRHYTPSHFDPKQGVCEVMFYLHDRGPGSRWADALAIGDTLKMIGPGGKMQLDRRASYHIVYGDETSIGLFKCFNDHFEHEPDRCICIADLPDNHRNWLELAQVRGVSATPYSLHRNDEAPMKFAYWFRDFTGEKSEITFYLTGNAKGIQNFRKYLLKNGFSKSQIHSDPYWSEGKCGL